MGSIFLHFCVGHGEALFVEVHFHFHFHRMKRVLLIKQSCSFHPLFSPPPPPRGGRPDRITSSGQLLRQWTTTLDMWQKVCTDEKEAGLGDGRRTPERPQERGGWRAGRRFHELHVPNDADTRHAAVHGQPPAGHGVGHWQPQHASTGQSHEPGNPQGLAFASSLPATCGLTLLSVETRNSHISARVFLDSPFLCSQWVLFLLHLWTSQALRFRQPAFVLLRRKRRRRAQHRISWLWKRAVNAPLCHDPPRAHPCAMFPLSANCFCMTAMGI